MLVRLVDMLDRLVEFFLSHPKCLVAGGEALYSAASALLVVGACANVYTGAIAAVHSLGKRAPSPSTLADLLPGFPTWWVPETLAAFTFVIAVAIVGAVIAHQGRILERFLST